MFSKLLLILSIALIPILVTTELHAICKLANGHDGHCQLFENCKSARRDIHFGIALHITEICGIEFICCENERDIERRNGESSEVDMPASQMLLSQNCYSGKSIESQGEEANKLVYSTTDDKQIEGDSFANENNFLVKIGIRNANGDLHFFCGGILIKPQFALTAAHCIDYRGRAPEVVQIGNSNGNDNENQMENIPITRAHSHPDYTKLTMYHDIALLELAIASSYLPVCMGSFIQKDVENAVTFALGHDMHNDNAKQSMTVDIMSNDYCNDVYANSRKIPHGVLESQFCIANLNITEASKCKHFVGGPLLTKKSNGEFYLIGLANYVHMCYSTIYPMIYTKIASYNQWLESIFNQDIKNK